MTELKQWQIDLLTVQADLKARLAHLADFTASETIDLLPQSEQALIRHEQAMVVKYLGAVSARISYFGDELEE